MTLALIALGLWMGGMIALGPIAAPVVFRMVPAPTSGDAMTVVFQRFDRLAVACVVVVLAVEACLALLRDRKITRVDLARGALAAVGAGLAIYVGLVVSPQIAALHAAGAVRGSGLLGIELDRAHHLAERLGQAELAAAIGIIALHVIALTPARSSPGAQGDQKVTRR